MDNNGLDYNALRGINPKFSMLQTSDLSATKVKQKTFSMPQGRPLTQNPKISSTHNASYESSEFTKRLVYYPGSRRFFQCSNTELSLSPTKIDGFPHSGNFVVFVQSL